MLGEASPPSCQEFLGDLGASCSLADLVEDLSEVWALLDDLVVLVWAELQALEGSGLVVLSLVDPLAPSSGGIELVWKSWAGEGV